MVGCVSRAGRTAVLVSAVVLAVVTTGVSAALTPPPSAPQVVFDSSTSTVGYKLAAPPDNATHTVSGSGLRSRRSLTKEVSNGHGRASAQTTQTTKTLHGPTPQGYSVRRILASGTLSGAAEIKELKPPNVTASSTADSQTSFTVDRQVAFALTTTRSAQAGDPADCSLATVTLKQAGTVVFRKTTATAGCTAVPEDTGTGSGNLVPGDYTLETHVSGEARALSTYNKAYVAPMNAKVTAALQLGKGKVCRNVLPRTGATIRGTAGNDVLCGGPGKDTIKGFGGNDLILGQGRGDVIYAGPGADVVKPGPGRDVVRAGGGNDTVRACDNTRDVLRGQRGSDRVFRDRGDRAFGFESKRRC